MPGTDLIAVSKTRSNPENQLTWFAIVRPLSISEHDLKKSGFDPQKSTRLPEEYGGGYLVTIEVNHQLHCLVSTYTRGKLNRFLFIKSRTSYAKQSIGTTTKTNLLNGPMRQT